MIAKFTIPFAVAFATVCAYLLGLNLGWSEAILSVIIHTALAFEIGWLFFHPIVAYATTPFVALASIAAATMGRFAWIIVIPCDIEVILVLLLYIGITIIRKKR